MKFIRTKKLVCMNNKGGVGKTTITYNLAVAFAQKGYKTVMVDLDPQCNLSLLTLGEAFGSSLFSGDTNNIYGILQDVIGGRGDVNHDIQPQIVSDNLSIVPGSIRLSAYEDLLATAYNQAASGTEIGYFQTSAISRYIHTLGLEQQVDLIIMDVSPTLGLLNRVILLGSDYFITPLMPDAFSVQGVENLGITLDKWKRNWKNTGVALAGNIANNHVLQGEGLFLGYIVNSYNQYNQKPIQSHEERMKKIPHNIKKYISEKHCKNGLVQTSRKEPLIELKDYGELSADSHRTNKAIFDLIPGKDFSAVAGTKENRDIAQKQFETLYKNIEQRMQEY